MTEDIDVVLSGTGVRLGCTYGALQVLRSKYIIKRIAGTSGGAIMAAALVCHPEFNKIGEILKSIDFEDLMCDGKWNSWIRLISENGLYKGDAFEKFIETNISMGKRLKNVPNLFIVITNLTTNEPMVLSFNNYPDMKVSYAVRMSMSAPYYWVPKYLTINNKKNTIIDGGIAANYYIDLFDDEPRKTIGVCLFTSIKQKAAFGIIDYVASILDTMMMCNEKEHIDDAHWANTIRIDTADITPFNLKITKEQVAWCIEQGYQQTIDALNKKIK